MDTLKKVGLFILALIAGASIVGLAILAASTYYAFVFIGKGIAIIAFMAFIIWFIFKINKKE